MSKDQMQDVFPIVFDFVKGEQPTAQKLTGLVKQTNTAFSQITQGVGDPWDYSSHTAGGTRYPLSLENLAQASLARIIGPSDYLSPFGGCWNEQIPAGAYITVTLSGYQNSWTLGYPLVKLEAPVVITETSTPSVTTPLEWGTDIDVAADAGSVLNTEKSSLQEVIADGDFYVDYYKGTITSYKRVGSTSITLHIYSLNMFGAGVPWSTHNIIPSWGETTTLCEVTKESSTATTTTYSLTFPTLSLPPRTTPNITYGKEAYRPTTWTKDVIWSTPVSGYGSSYRIPLSLENSGLVEDDEIPEGMCLLWEGGEDGRVIPQVTFLYKDLHGFYLRTPKDWLDEGSNYRVIITGSSVAENINYLQQIARNNEHIGLAFNQTLSYTVPLSHRNLENRYTGEIPLGFNDDVDRWKYRESSYPINPHPQYLHRAGYLADDLNGNTANAMRGDLVLGGVETGGDTLAFTIGSGATLGSVTLSKTAAISFGGGDTDKTSNDCNPFLVFEGTSSDGSWSTGRAERSVYGLYGTGSSIPSIVPASDLQYTGSLSLYPWKGTPLVLKGHRPASGTESYCGATLGFDLGRRNEGNYIRLMMAYRAEAYNNIANIPTELNQIDFNNPIDQTPELTHRLAAEQIREFRFRGVSYVEDATNTSDSIGGSGLRSTNTISEFQHHFTSPAIVGADFFNVYSNAIFFSDTGDGATTSFTDNGKTWLDGGAGSSEYIPSGIYYTPGLTPKFDFRLHSSNVLIKTDTSFTVGVSEFTYNGYGTASIWSALGNLTLKTTTGLATLESTYGPVAINAGTDARVISATGNTYVESTAGSISISTTTGLGGIVITSHDSTIITSTNSDIRLMCEDRLYVSAPNTSSGSFGYTTVAIPASDGFVIKGLRSKTSSSGVSWRPMYWDEDTGQVCIVTPAT